MSTHRLKRALAPNWYKRAACLHVEEKELLFPPNGEPGLKAKRVCAGCPVQAACLQYALETDQRWGVWGGTSPLERRAMVQQSVVGWVAECGRHE